MSKKKSTIYRENHKLDLGKNHEQILHRGREATRSLRWVRDAPQISREDNCDFGVGCRQSTKGENGSATEVEGRVP